MTLSMKVVAKFNRELTVVIKISRHVVMSRREMFSNSS